MFGDQASEMRWGQIWRAPFTGIHAFSVPQRGEMGEGVPYHKFHPQSHITIFVHKEAIDALAADHTGKMHGVVALQELCQ